MDAEDELRIDLRNTSPRGSAVVDDLLFAADGIGEVEAFLVRPATRAARPGAGVVWWHWLDTEAPDGDRTEFLEEAVGHAGDGTVSLLLQGRFPWKGAPSGSGADARQIADEVLRLRRGLDLLVARSDVDAARLAVVGHDFGGMLAILALAGDRRPKGAVILAPAPRWGDWCLPFWRIEEDRIDYLRGLRPFDPIEQVGAIAPRPLLLQFAEHDCYLAPMVEFEFQRAAGATAGLKRYPGGHDLKVDAARDDRRGLPHAPLGIWAITRPSSSDWLTRGGAFPRRASPCVFRCRKATHDVTLEFTVAVAARTSVGCQRRGKT